MRRADIAVGDTLTWVSRSGPISVQVLDTRLGWTKGGLANKPLFVADQPGWHGVLVRAVHSGYETVVAARVLHP